MVIPTGKKATCHRCGKEYEVGCVRTPICPTCRAAPVHELKTWPVYYDAIVGGIKTFDVRKGNDRHYLVGDHLMLREYSKDIGYTGQVTFVEVVYVMHGGEWLPDDVWVLGIRKL